MNSLTIPPSPNWYETNILACAPDNTLIYGARNDIVILENNSDPNQAANVRVISRAHTQKVLTVCINKKWGQPKKLVVSTSDDRIVKLWNVETGKKQVFHDKHLADNKVVYAAFAGEERIISVSEEGNIVIWNLPLNETTVLKDTFGMKVTVTCMSTCPHATWVTAFGLKTGLIVVMDVRKNGKILHKMRGHDKSVVSLSWCPVPINIFPKIPHNYVGQKKEEQLETGEVSKSAQQSAKLKNAETDKKVDTVSDTPAIHPLLKVYDSSDEDFLKECDILKKIISGTSLEQVTYDDGSSSSLDDELQSLLNLAKIQDISKLTENVKGKTINISNELTQLETHVDDGSSANKLLGADNNQRTEVNQKVVVLVEDVNVSGQATEVTASEFNNKIVTNTVESKAEPEPTSPPKPVEDCKATNKKLDDISITTDSISDLHQETDVNKETIAENRIEKTVQEADATSVDVTKTTISSKTSIGSEITKEHSVKTETQKTKTCEEVGRNIEVISEEEEPRKEFLLASSARESNVYIWRAGTDGRMQTFLTLPNKPISKYRSNEKLWITLCWISPTVLLSPSRKFELIAWNLPKPKQESQLVKIIHKDHESPIFSIVAPVLLSDKHNWKDGPKANNVWTTSQDRLLLNTSLNNERTNLACYPTIGGSILCLQSSPVDPNRLAIGTTDNSLKIWDLSRPHVNRMTMTTFYQKIHGRVSALAWHPSNEQVLAFATIDGRIGVLDPTRMKTPILLKQHFQSTIFKLEWAPISGVTANLGLYAVAEGNIVYFNINKTTRDPIEFDKPGDVFIYSMAWTPDYSLMMTVTKTGYLIIYSPFLRVVCKHYLKYRLQEILWHPSASDSTSPQHNWLATVANSKLIIVYKFDIASANNDANVVNMYQSESDVINSIAWNPHEPTQLVISCDIGIIQIWDAENGEMLATYVNDNYEAITCAIWSPVDPDYIICAGKDSILKIWKISENPPKEEKDILRIRNTNIQEGTPKVVEQSEEHAKKNKHNKNNLLPIFYNPRNIAETISGFRKLLAWKENPKHGEIGEQGAYTNDILDVFGPDAALKNLVDANISNHKKKGKYTLNTTLSLFSGDISTTIQEAINEKRVTSKIVALAPMVSSSLWRSACETYAEQLSEERNSNPLEAVNYYLACHNVQKAINCLCDAHLYREAFTLAKSRMVGAKVINDIVDKWANQVKSDGHFELAAQCYIFLGKYEEAATLLFRRSDLQIFEFLVELSQKCDNKELQKAALYRYNTHKEYADKMVKKEIDLPTIQEAYLQVAKDSANNQTEDVVEVNEDNEKEELVQQGDTQNEESNEKLNAHSATTSIVEDNTESVENIVAEAKERILQNDILLDAIERAAENVQNVEVERELPNEVKVLRDGIETCEEGESHKTNSIVKKSDTD